MNKILICFICLVCLIYIFYNFFLIYKLKNKNKDKFTETADYKDYFIYQKELISKINFGNTDITSIITQYFNDNNLLLKSTKLNEIIKKDFEDKIELYDKNNKLLKLIKVNKDKDNYSITNEIINKEFYDKVVDILSKINDDIIVVTFTDNKYIKMFNIFYEYYSKLNLDNLVVISLDKEAYNILKNRNIRTILIEYNIKQNSFSSFWRFRFEILNLLLKISKKNLIHTDSDCIWKKNIIPLIKDIDCTLIAQIEHGMPRKISDKYGFIMCCGFFYIKYNDDGLKLLNNIYNLNINDDQVAFNTYIFDNKKKIEMFHNKILQFEITLKDNIKIGLINETYSARGKNYNKDLYNFHPYLPSDNIDNKIKDLFSRMT
jgi:hypothetical protein